ncbi:DUF1345 domain-containing protein [Cellulomonas dongxiuzhuiae]|uniref:DUF1345 domain-containing protein n=1 Tax=Cellulomonas dongxiuzhuiae TaxID=2819979 RepID=UPI0020369E55|nr:DUF1345 domain-containing protein [Cellulomonas dongxiuzhuiae]
MTRNPAYRDVTPAARLAVASGAGVIAGWGVATAYAGSFAAALLSGWAVAGLVFAGWSWAFLWPLDAEQTRTHSLREEPTRLVTHALVVGAGVMSLVGVVVVLATHDRGRVLALVSALVAVVASWTSLHTVFALRYARIWYTPPYGEIDFHQEEPPRYSDFAYVAFTVAMSFAMSDPDVRSSDLRRVVLAHALLSYLFGTVIVALLVNVVAGLTP